MATTAQRLIINVETGTLLPSFEGVVGTTQPRYVLGDSTPVEIYLVKTQGALGGVAQVPFPAGSTIRLGVGVVNQPPTSGSWSLTWNGDTATGLAYNITPAALQTALNALASITAAGGVTVAAIGEQYQITFNNAGTRVAFTGDNGTLVPISGVSITTLQEGSVSEKEIVLVHLAVSPIALSTTFTDVAAPAGAYSATAFSLSGGVRGGGYKLQLTFTQGATTKTVWTDTITVGLSLQDISQLIFNALTNAGWGTVTGNATKNAWGLRVVALDTYSWRVDFTSPEFTTPLAQSGPTIVGIDVSGITALAGKQGELNIATAEAVAYLGTEESKRAVLELEVTAASVVQTLLQVSCDLLGEVIVDGVFAPVPLDVPLAESVANNRFVRRDADQTLDSTSKNQIWENLLGVTTPSGVNIIDALVGANLPSSTNVLVTQSDLPNQSLNTTDNPTFVNIDANSVGFAFGSQIDCTAYVANDGTTNIVYAATGITFNDATVQSTAAVFFDQSLNTTDAATFTEVTATDGLTSTVVDEAGITYPDATVQESAPIVSAGTSINGGGGGHIDKNDYPDEIRIVIGGVTYAMPARVI